LADAVFFTAISFATMAAAPSHIVILLAHRAGTINRLRARGNGARRPIRPPRCGAQAGLKPLCPAPHGVIRRPGEPEPASPGIAIRVMAWGTPSLGRRSRPGHPAAGKPVGRARPGPVHWAQRKALKGTSSAVRSHQRPGDGASPGASATRRSPPSRRKNARPGLVDPASRPNEGAVDVPVPRSRRVVPREPGLSSLRRRTRVSAGGRSA
jgi:hypothetical protein